MIRLLVVFAIVFTIDAAAYGQSLADVARQEEARRKSVSRSGRVYTNQDLPETTTPAAPLPPAVVAGRSDAEPSKESGKAAEGDAVSEADKKLAANPYRNEKQWRERAQQYRTGLSQTRTDIAGIESRLETLRAAKQTPAIASEVKLVEEDLRMLQSKLQSLEKEWARVEKQANDTGASAWIRE